MKRLGIVAVFIMLMFVVTAAQAEVRAGSFSVTPFFGGYVFEGNEHDLEDSWTAGVRAGYNFTNHVGVEGYFNYILTDTSKWDPIYKADDARIGGFGVEGLYNLLPNNWLVPFLAVGIGGIHYSWENPQISDTTKLSFDYGGGIKLFLPDQIAKLFFVDDIALRADVRHILPFNSQYNDFLYTAGINFAFGGTKKAEEPASADSDGDGVPDSLDKCPNTPKGCIVDRDGCPIDSDKDGVSDCLDKCPDTPKGCIVDKDGCPIDSDKDGVPDCLDKCPHTPAGATVDKDGCSHEKISMRINVEFDTAKYDIKEKYRDELKKAADFIKAHPETHAVIEGHTDSVGAADYNQRLSENRANRVREYLIQNFGVDASNLSSKGYGKTMPIAGNDTMEGRQLNRRVEAVLEAVEIK